jgi:histidinol phosphatase-like enzyme (inositol monophosphatase family)
MPHDLDEIAAFAHRLADASGRAILPFFRKSTTGVEDKGALGPGLAQFDPVTEADRQGETAIRDLIKAAYPRHGILGEEHGHEPGADAAHWVIDPIDGTRAFICGNPQWGTLIAFNDGARPVVGVIDQPYTGERWIGWNGQSAFHSREGVAPMRTRACRDLSQAVISSTHPWAYFTPQEQAVFRTLDASVRMTRFGGDCYGYGLLASGFLDVIIEARLKPWDVQALIPVIEGAGGIITGWDGGPPEATDRIVAAGDARVHAQVLEVINRR